jgi:hypothetical protein
MLSAQVERITATFPHEYFLETSALIRKVPGLRKSGTYLYARAIAAVMPRQLRTA